MSEQPISNIDIVLYALSLLGGTTKKVPSETIALKSYELEPSKFSWRLYPQYPDLEAVNKALFDARRKKYGKLVSGRFDGWIFSPEGIAWMEENRVRIVHILGNKKNPVNRTEVAKKLNELESSTAFKKFLKENNCSAVKPYEFTDFLSASLDTPPSILRDKIAKIRALAATGKKQKILDFINQCELHFSSTLKI